MDGLAEEGGFGKMLATQVAMYYSHFSLPYTNSLTARYVMGGWNVCMYAFHPPMTGINARKKKRFPCITPNRPLPVAAVAAAVAAVAVAGVAIIPIQSYL